MSAWGNWASTAPSPRRRRWRWRRPAATICLKSVQPSAPHLPKNGSELQGVGGDAGNRGIDLGNELFAKPRRVGLIPIDGFQKLGPSGRPEKYGAALPSPQAKLVLQFLPRHDTIAVFGQRGQTAFKLLLLRGGNGKIGIVKAVPKLPDQGQPLLRRQTINMGVRHDGLRFLLP